VFDYIQSALFHTRSVFIRCWFFTTTCIRAIFLFYTVVLAVEWTVACVYMCIYNGVSVCLQQPLHCFQMSSYVHRFQHSDHLCFDFPADFNKTLSPKIYFVKCPETLKNHSKKFLLWKNYCCLVFDWCCMMQFLLSTVVVGETEWILTGKVTLEFTSH